jgi:hypothetical protein
LIGSLVFLLVAAYAPGQVTVQIGLNFTGSVGGLISQSLPPDPNGAIGPGYFMEFINGTVAFYNRTNGLSVTRKTDLKFWTDAGLITSAIAVSDPRVIYDPVSQRWFVTQIDLDPNASDPTAEANDFLIAVSTNSNPRGAWKAYMVQADPDNGFFADFPTLGVDSNAVYISGDFYSAGSVPEGPGLVSIPKADLIAATPTVANLTWHGVMNIADRGQIMQPATCFDGSENGCVLAMGDVGTTSDFYSNIVCSVVLNANTPTATLATPVSLTVDPYDVPDNDILGVPAYAAPQPDGTVLVQANDGRISGKVFAVGGVLYATHQTELNGRMAIQWYRIRAADQTLLEQGTIADPNLDLFMPSIAANQYGTVVIGCNGSGYGPTDYISCYAYAGQTVNGKTTFGSSILLKAGTLNYHDLLDVFGQLVDMPTLSRWGDYSTLSVDAADPTQFWSEQMYPYSEDTGTGLGDTLWATQITQLFVTVPPPLATSPSGTNVVVSWPLYASSYSLYSATNLTPPVAWSSVTNKPTTNGIVISATIPHTGGAKFFRLQK